MGWAFVTSVDDFTCANRFVATFANRLQTLEHEVFVVKSVVPLVACAWPKIPFARGRTSILKDDSQRLLGLLQDHAAQVRERRSHA